MNTSSITIFATELKNVHLWLGVVRLSAAAHLIYFSLDVGPLSYLFLERTISWYAIVKVSIIWQNQFAIYQFAFSSWWMSTAVFGFHVLSASRELNKVNSSGITIFATALNNVCIWLGIVRLHTWFISPASAIAFLRENHFLICYIAWNWTWVLPDTLTFFAVDCSFLFFLKHFWNLRVPSNQSIIPYWQQVEVTLTFCLWTIGIHLRTTGIHLFHY